MIEVHVATREDVGTIANWQMAMAFETEQMRLDPDTVRRGVTHIFDYPETGYYLIAKIDGLPVACTLVLYEWSDWRAGCVLWIHSVYVVPEKRQSGVFRSIYRHLETLVADDTSLRGLRLYVDKSNHAAIRTYTSLGMRSDHYELFERMK